MKAATQKQHEGFDLQMQRSKMEIPDHTDNHPRHIVSEPHLPVYGRLRRIPAQHPPRCIVDHDVLPLGFPVKRSAMGPAGKQFHAEGLDEIQPDLEALHVMPDITRIVDPLYRAGRHLAYVAGQSGQGPAVGHPGHTGMLQQGLFPRLEVVPYCVQRGYHDHLLFVESQVPIPDEFRLVEQNARADDQRGGNRELDDNQDLPRHCAGRIESAASLHTLNRLRGGQQEGRIASRKQPDDQRNRRQDEQPKGMTREVRGYRLSRKIVEIR